MDHHFNPSSPLPPSQQPVACFGAKLNCRQPLPFLMKSFLFHRVSAQVLPQMAPPYLSKTWQTICQNLLSVTKVFSWCSLILSKKFCWCCYLNSKAKAVLKNLTSAASSHPVLPSLKQPYIKEEWSYLSPLPTFYFFEQLKHDCVTPLMTRWLQKNLPATNHDELHHDFILKTEN